MSVAYRSQFWRQTVETNCKNKPCQLDRADARRGFLLFIWFKLQHLCCRSCTRFWHSRATRFNNSLGVCSSLDPMSSNFSSVIIQSLCFCFLSIKSSVALSLFTKLLIVCLLGKKLLISIRMNVHKPTFHAVKRIISKSVLKYVGIDVLAGVVMKSSISWGITLRISFVSHNWRSTDYTVLYSRR
jgi:hypothetical protein